MEYNRTISDALLDLKWKEELQWKDDVWHYRPHISAAEMKAKLAGIEMAIQLVKEMESNINNAK